jgi:hypothetical protein
VLRFPWRRNAVVLRCCDEKSDAISASSAVITIAHGRANAYSSSRSCARRA